LAIARRKADAAREKVADGQGWWPPIDEYIAHHNTNPKPFIWTKSARDIQQKVIRANSR